MNTIKHYLEQIKDPEVRERALRNMEDDVAELEDEDVPGALFAAFVFHESPEGWDYWIKIYENINQYI